MYMLSLNVISEVPSIDRTSPRSALVGKKTSLKFQGHPSIAIGQDMNWIHHTKLSENWAHCRPLTVQTKRNIWHNWWCYRLFPRGSWIFCSPSGNFADCRRSAPSSCSPRNGGVEWRSCQNLAPLILCGLCNTFMNKETCTGKVALPSSVKY